MEAALARTILMFMCLCSALDVSTSKIRRNSMSGGDSMYDLTRAFHDDIARHRTTNDPAMKQAKKRQLGLLERLRGGLKEREPHFNKYEYTGSSYEALKVWDPDEFDTMAIITATGTCQLSPIHGHAGFFTVKVKDTKNPRWANLIDSAGLLLPQKAADAFFGKVQQGINDLDLHREVKVRKHGPAVQLDVLDGSGRPAFSVDLVLAYDVDGKYVIAKAPKNAQSAAARGAAWRQSFSREEKRKLEDLDRGNGCRKQCLRILKAIFEKEAALKPLTSYIIKNLVFHESEKRDLDWNQKYIDKRLVGLLSSLGQHLEKGRLSNFFIPGMNLLEGISSTTLKQMETRLRGLYENEHKLRRSLSVESRDEL